MDQEETLPPEILKVLAEKVQMSQDDVKKIVNNPIYDRCLGAIYGAMFGDALGSYCEFATHVTQSTIETLIQMPGGGTFSTYPGQVTDDSEMALHLLEGLLQYDSNIPLQDSIDKISLQLSRQYINWVQSHPFDIGNTTMGGIQILYHSDCHLGMENLLNAFKQIGELNGKSLSNGYLMRNTPLAVFLTLAKQNYKEEAQKVDRLIENDIKMTHSNKICLESGKEWIYLLSDLILREDFDDIKGIYEKFYDKKTLTNQFRQWKKQGQTEPLMPATVNQGFAKIAYSYGLMYLKKIIENHNSQESLNATLYTQIMAAIIRKGGDTDTNAAIVGGLLGSLVGFRKLPNKYKAKQFDLSLQKGSKPTDRPSFYQPRNALYNCVKLVKKFVKV